MTAKQPKNIGMNTPQKLETIIQATTELNLLVQRARATDAVGLDTEFVWERTYYPRLGLIQLALSDEECYLIDPLAIGDLSPLGKLLADRSVVKIFHDAPQDLGLLYTATNCVPQNIFDTRLAAGFCNLPSTLSLQNLVMTLLEISLTKEETRTNWLQRPLSAKQCNYALDDVRYLRAVRVLLLSRIVGPRIRSWLQEELNQLNNPATYQPLPDQQRYLKINGQKSLDPKGLAVLQLLAAWRETVARKLDRPRGHIVKDHALTELARVQPAEMSKLKASGILSDNALRKYGEALLKVIDAANKQPQSKWPEENKPLRLSSKAQADLDRLKKLITLKCQILGIDPALLATSSELKKLALTMSGKAAASSGDLRQTEGWRKEFLSDYFRQSHHSYLSSNNV